MTEISHTFQGMLVGQQVGIHDTIHVRSRDGALDVTLRDENGNLFPADARLFKDASVTITISYNPANEVSHPFRH